MEDLTGKKFGALTAMIFERMPNGAPGYKCRCDCGVEKLVRSAHLDSGAVVSCGCGKKKGNKTHGKYRTPTWITWMNMIQRCTNPDNPAYANYGGRGIKVCSRWRDSFQAFLDDMGEKPPGLTIERSDNDGDYEPGNCSWAGRVSQARNQRTTRLLEFNGRTQPLTAWAEELKLSAALIHTRLHRGWSVSRALSKN